MNEYKLIDKYPAIGQCIPHVKNIVKILREYPDAELEARFGQIKDKTFISGVSRTTIDEILNMMKESPYIKVAHDWVEEQDFFYTYNKKQLRTRVKYDSENMKTRPHTIEKSNLGTFDASNISNNSYDIRVSLKREVPINVNDICVNTSLVRIKQRKRLLTTCKTWAFDFGMVWCGATKTDAELAQSNNDPIFEIECELIDPTKYLSLHDDAYIATSLLLKMIDLIGESKFIPK